jgi:histidinol-phosphate aminotransferase
LRAAGTKVAPSSANFLCFAPRGDAHALWERLAARGVLLRDVTAAAPGYLRVTVGSREENEIFLAELQETM